MFDFLLGSDALSAVIAFILVLIPAVIIHEIGHFVAAKLVGITILEFGVGMPPRMLRLFRFRGTDYTINWLPLGGFVRPMGEGMVSQMGDDDVSEDRQEALARGIKNPMSVMEAKPAARIFFFVNGAIFNFIMAIVLFIIIGMTGVPQQVGELILVQQVEPNSVFAEAGLVEGDVIEQVNGEYIPNGVIFYDQLNTASNGEATLLVQRENEAEPLTLTLDTNGETFAVQPHVLIVGVAPQSPAEEAGILAGDVVTTFNDVDIPNFETLQRNTAQNLGQEVTLTINRNGEILQINVTPRENPPQGQGSIGIEIGSTMVADGQSTLFRDGIPYQQLASLSLTESIQYGFGRVADTFNAILSVPGQIIAGTAEPESLRLTSPLGISQAGAVFLQESIQQDRPGIILEFMALISIALGFTNLLPIPALDGGRVLFVLIEMLRGKPIAPEREGMVHLIGLALLFSLMIVVLFQDITNPLTNLLR